MACALKEARTESFEVGAIRRVGENIRVREGSTWPMGLEQVMEEMDLNKSAES